MMNSNYMEQALELARQGVGQTSPNPAVGAVLVRDGAVIGRGFHVYNDRAHAETIALQQAGDLARGATLYINLEPCSHHGRTPPCADALIAAGVAKVVAAMEDPDPRVSGEGFRKLRAAGIAVELDRAHAAAARKLNEAFTHFKTTGRPFVTLKSAMTLDGKISAPVDNDGWITSERARAHVQQLRHASDSILTGIGTVLGDDCLLTDRTDLPRSRPLLRIVLDSQLRISLESNMVRNCRQDVLIVTTSAASIEKRAALEGLGVEVITLDGKAGRTDMPALMGVLASRNYQSLMIEAGSMVNWAALETGVVDRIYFYYAPKILGGLQSLPVAGGQGRSRRKDALLLRDVSVHPIPPDEYAVEAYLQKE